MRKIFIFSLMFILCSCKQKGPQYNGYIDADLTYISSNYSGRLANLFVHRGQEVKSETLLFKLEPKTESYAIKTSKFNDKYLTAQRKQIIDKLTYSEINYKRTLAMRKDNAASQNDLDVAKKDLDVLKSQLVAIDFQLESSKIDTANRKWQLSRKEGCATDYGLIFDTYFTQNEYVQAGQPVLSLITKKNIKVIFFVPEKDLSNIILNKKIKISSDASNLLATGSINYISNIAQYTSPLIFSREERHDLVFRVEAKIERPDLNKIHLGLPITLEIL